MGPVFMVEVEVVLLALYRMSGVPSAFILVVVVDLLVVVAGACDVLVVMVLVELLLIVLLAGAVCAWADKPPATSKAIRKPRKFFMEVGRKR